MATGAFSLIPPGPADFLHADRHLGDQVSGLPLHRPVVVPEPGQGQTAQPDGSAVELGQTVIEGPGEVRVGQLLRSTKDRTFSRALSRISGPCVKAATEYSTSDSTPADC